MKIVQLFATVSAIVMTFYAMAAKDAVSIYVSYALLAIAMIFWGARGFPKMKSRYPIAYIVIASAISVVLAIALFENTFRILSMSNIEFGSYRKKVGVTLLSYVAAVMFFGIGEFVSFLSSKK